MSTIFTLKYTERMSSWFLITLFMAISLIFSNVCHADSPHFLNCPDSTIAIGHCDIYRYNFETNLEGTGNPPKIKYSIAETDVNGQIIITPVSGILRYYPSMMDVRGRKYISIQACHISSGRCDTCTVSLDVLNTAPETFLDQDTVTVSVGDTLRVFPVVAQDDDFCDVLQYWLREGPGEMGIDYGLYTWVPGEDDEGVHDVLVYVSDGMAHEAVTFHVEVLVRRPYEVEIDLKHDVMQGFFVDVDVSLNKGSETMGGFNFILGYNATALAFTEAALSQQLVDCGWEYFTYRFNWNGNCGDYCPSGLLRLVGMAETNNGPHHPDLECISDVDQIATLTFFVSNDRTLECSFLPISFYWMDCGDNTIAVPSGDTLALNRYITDYNGNQIQDYGYGFPGCMGAPNDPCLDGDRVTPVRFIDFINGGIDLICNGPIDARGDINVNGLSNEIADWVMFLNYFMQGINAFGGHVEGSIQSSDVNCDGTTLRLEDFIRLAQIVVGNAEPCEEDIVPDTITADFMWDNQQNVFYVGSPYHKLTAVYMVFLGEIFPTLDLDSPNLNLAFTHDSGITRILIYPNLTDDPPEFNMCRLFSYTGIGELVEIQTADLYNHVIVNDFYSDVDDNPNMALPSDYLLLQNHPNPFNPSTEIRFIMPRATNVTLEIFNILGQKIITLVDKRLSAGNHAVVWDGYNLDGKKAASGIYIYRLNAGEYSSTRQMILSK